MKTLVIAIDFGTAYSGFSYCIDNSDIVTWVKWHSHNQYKNETVILYEIKNSIISPLEWGRSAIEQYNKILKEEKDRAVRLKLITEPFKLNIKSKQPVIVSGVIIPITLIVADFLKLMKDFILKVLPDQKIDVNDYKVRWCVTIPAIWDDSDKELMRVAIEKAGIVTLNQLNDPEFFRFALEPEAAAVCCRLLSKDDLLKDKDCFMIIDVGGGTIDITTYMVLDSKKGTLEEMYKATGDTQGGEFVNEAIIQYIQKNAQIGLEIKNCDGYHRFRENLVKAKHSFEYPSKTTKIRIEKVPNSIGKYLKNSKIFDDEEEEITIPVEDFKKCFNNSINSATKHISEVLKTISGIKVVYCVGGFMASDYFFNSLAENFKDKGIAFIRPPQSELAIVHGACLFARNPSVIQTRVLPQTYGVEIYEEFDPKIHDPKKKVTLGNKECCGSLFCSYGKLNEKITNRKEVIHHFSQPDPSATSVKIVIYGSNKIENPMYIDEPGVEKIGEFSCSTSAQGVDVVFCFGDTQLIVKAIDCQTKKIEWAVIEYSKNVPNARYELLTKKNVLDRASPNIK